MIWRALALSVLLAGPAVGAETSDAQAGVLRWLDKLTGQTTDIELGRGQSATWGHLTVQLDDCRYPTDSPTADAIAHLTVQDTQSASVVFSGWMMASSPALSALDHPRYDVWVLNCVLPEGVGVLAEVPEDEAPAEDEALATEGDTSGQ